MSNSSLFNNDVLIALQTQLKTASIVSLFHENPSRVEECSVEAAGLHLDYSKNIVNSVVMSALIEAADQKQLSHKIDALFSGAAVNYTEKRPALHTALRFAPKAPDYALSCVLAAHDKMKQFVDKVQSGAWLGSTGKPITDVVNIGIGGSDLGPAMVYQALSAYWVEGLRCHFVSNIDAEDVLSVLSSVSPETTLFVVASKTFTTLETLTNANTARSWLTDVLGTEVDVSKHFVATTSNEAKAIEFGIHGDNVFPMWDWVGGRYSLWSSIGLPVALGIGFEHFRALLDGAKQMDSHFIEAPFSENMPVILALLGVWYSNYWQAQTHAVIPYSHQLRLFPKYLQQLDMESNGKSVTHDQFVAWTTGPIVWGEAGTNGQHSFHQLLHQGTRLVPVDFIAPVRAHHNESEHQLHLFSNCLSQSYALMAGKSLEQAKQEFQDAGYTEQDAGELAHHKVMPGNRPSNTITMDQLTPNTLGSLIALYEHKVFVQSIMWDINPFDQWGVELGKKISGLISSVIKQDQFGDELDPSTLALIRRYQNQNQN